MSALLQRQQSTRALRVLAPARLHLGFLDLNGGLGRRYGSIGLAVDTPATELCLRRAQGFSSSGPESERALKAVRRFAEILALEGQYSVEVARAIPAHAGLGSGTQLALAVGAALMTLEGLSWQAQKLGELVERGARSAIGMAAFEQGGFIIDGGRGAGDRPPPVLVRADFPDDWRVLLILDRTAAGVHGDREAEAFAALPPFPDSAASRLCRLVLMRLLPGLKETDIAAFGSALSEIQDIVGGHFAAAQGGSKWTSRGVGRMASRLAEAGAHGIGQSSWGPTGFAFVSSADEAARLYHSLVEDATAEGLEIRIASGRNTGAHVEPMLIKKANT